MMQQTEFFKTVRDSVVAAQSRATEKFGAIEGEARKVIDGLVERGRESLPQAKAKVEGFQKRAFDFVDTTSREQVVVVAGGLRKWADRLERIVVKAAAAAEEQRSDVDAQSEELNA